MACENSYLSRTLTANILILLLIPRCLLCFRASAQCVIHPEDVAGDTSDSFDPYKIPGAQISTLECGKSGLLEKNRDELLEQVAEDACPGRIRTADVPDKQYFKYIELSKELIVVLCYIDYRSHEDKQGKVACLPLGPVVGIGRG